MMKNIVLNKNKINSYLLLGITLFYLTMYCVGFIYTPLSGFFSIANIIFFAIILLVNKDELLKEKKLIILFSAQFIYAIICKLFNGTGWGSVLQISNMLFVVLTIPYVTIDDKYFKWMRYAIPIFYLIFLFCPKEHLNPNYVGYIFLCFYIFSITIYNLDSKGKKAYLFLLTILMLVCIHFFRCRTAMMCVMLVYALMHFKKGFFTNKKFKRYMPIFLVFISFILAAIYIVLWKNQFLIDSRLFVGKSFYSGRNRIWNEILPLIFQHPIFGVGSKYVLKSFPTYAMHNTTFMISVTFGLPSLCIYFYAIRELFSKFLQKAKNNFSYRLIFAVITVLIFNDIFESYIYWSNFNLMFFAISIALINRNRMIEKTIVKTDKKRLFIFEEGIDRVGGVERVVSTLANNFSKKYDVNVISFYKTANEIFYKYDENVNISFLMNQMNKKSTKYGKKHPLHYIYRIYEKMLDELVLLPRLSKVMNSLSDEDVIILGRVDVALKVYPLVVNCNKIIIRDAIHYLYFKRLTKFKVRRMFKNEQINFIVSSDESKKVYLENTKIKNIYKIYNPLGINAINKYNYFAKQIVAVGRYSSQKGFENLIKAFKIVNENNKDWTLKIVGAKDEKLQMIVDELKINNSVNLCDKSKNIVEILNDSSIYVMTSRYEGYANALVEALACGVPSISFDWLLGADDIIDDEKNGLIVKLTDRSAYAKGVDNPNDIKKLADAIIRLIKDEKLCKELSLNAHKKIMETRSIEKIISKWETIIDA